jgi:hypothetical protein
MTEERRAPEGPEARPELEPYLDALGDLRPPDDDSVPDSGAIDDPGEVVDAPAIDEPDPRLEQPDDTRTGGDR